MLAKTYGIIQGGLLDLWLFWAFVSALFPSERSLPGNVPRSNLKKGAPLEHGHDEQISRIWVLEKLGQDFGHFVFPYVSQMRNEE